MSEARNEGMTAKPGAVQVIKSKGAALIGNRNRAAKLIAASVLFAGVIAIGIAVFARRPIVQTVEDATQTAIRESEQRVKASLEAIKEVVVHTPTLAELRERVRAHPRDASARRELGDSLFEAKRPGPALRQYRQALKIDSKMATEKMTSNLVNCFGQREQEAAARLIVEHKLVGAGPGLAALTRNKEYQVRWAAMETLQKLGMASRSAYLHVYLADLDSHDCSAKRRAVEKLGAIGDQHALRAIETAAKKDQAEKHWYWFSCLGDRPQQALKEIRARTRVAMVNT